MTQAYQQAQQGAVLIDHQVWGRIALQGQHRLDLLHRISTNEMNRLPIGQAVPTVLTTPIGRIIDLLTVVNRGESTLAISSGGRGEAIFAYLRRNIFFNDHVQIADVSATMQHWGLYGAEAAQLLANRVPALTQIPIYHSLEVDGALILRLPPLAGAAFWLMGDAAALEGLRQRLMQDGAVSAGLDTYRLLRIDAGQPAPGRELTEDYISLEVGLWDAVSFSKGCYTGQEIIARMESRGKLAKMLYHLQTDAPLPDNSPLLWEGKTVGSVTTLALYPDGRYRGLGFIKTGSADAGSILHTREGIAVQLIKIAGTQPERTEP